MSTGPDRRSARQLAVKRAIDVVGSAAGLVVCSPLMIAVATLVRLRLGGPVLFTQKRPGLHGRLFTIHKFRTMKEGRDDAGQALPDEERLSRFGHALRATSLDELPELFDVLRGRMSLVGPRPLLADYLPLYSPEQARRHQMKPGITGWAQVNGRNDLSWDDKFALDLWYVDHWSLGLDLRILAMTILRVLTGTGVAKRGHVTTERFTGGHPTVRGQVDSAVGGGLSALPDSRCRPSRPAGPE